MRTTLSQIETLEGGRSNPGCGFARVGNCNTHHVSTARWVMASRAEVKRDCTCRLPHLWLAPTLGLSCSARSLLRDRGRDRQRIRQIYRVRRAETASTRMWSKTQMRSKLVKHWGRSQRLMDRPVSAATHCTVRQAERRNVQDNTVAFQWSCCFTVVKRTFLKPFLFTHRNNNMDSRHIDGALRSACK